MSYPSALSRLPHITAAALLVFTSACAGKDSAKAETASAVAPMMNMAADSGTKAKLADGAMDHSTMGGMAMTGDADRDFLRMMSDHHKGLIEMAHETIESKDKLGVKPIASRLDTAQDDELDKMTTMLETTFKDPYAPKVMPDNQAMTDKLKGKTGAAYDRQFLENVVMHHEGAIKMIDAYLPTAKMPAVKAMAEKMKAVQSKEIDEFKKQLAKPSM